MVTAVVTLHLTSSGPGYRSVRSHCFHLFVMPCDQHVHAANRQELMSGFHYLQPAQCVHPDVRTWWFGLAVKLRQHLLTFCGATGFHSHLSSLNRCFGLDAFVFQRAQTCNSQSNNWYCIKGKNSPSFRWGGWNDPTQDLHPGDRAFCPMWNQK